MLIVCSHRPWLRFFKSFRKGPVVCRGLDVNLSGKVAKKRLRHGKEVATPTTCSPWLSLRTKSVAEHGWGSSHCVYTHVAIVTRTQFRNAKPKFHMNCLPTISINDRSCQQRSTGPANISTCTYYSVSIFTIYKSTGKQQRNTHPHSYLYAQWNRTKLIIHHTSNCVSSSALRRHDVSERARKSNVNNIWLADASHPSRSTTFPRRETVTFLFSPGAFRNDKKRESFVPETIKKRLESYPG